MQFSHKDSSPATILQNVFSGYSIEEDCFLQQFVLKWEIQVRPMTIIRLFSGHCVSVSLEQQ